MYIKLPAKISQESSRPVESGGRKPFQLGSYRRAQREGAPRNPDGSTLRCCLQGEFFSPAPRQRSQASAWDAQSFSSTRTQSAAPMPLASGVIKVCKPEFNSLPMAR